MAFRHEVLHIRRQKQRLIDIPGAKILAHGPRLNQTRSELNSDYSDRLLDRPEPQASPDPGQDEAAVPAGEHALQIGTVDLDAGKARPARDVLEAPRKGFD